MANDVNKYGNIMLIQVPYIIPYTVDPIIKILFKTVSHLKMYITWSKK